MDADLDTPTYCRLMIGVAGRCRTFGDAHPQAVDAGAAAVFLLLVGLCGSGPLTAGMALLSGTLAACIVLRRRFPIPATAVATAGVVVGIAHVGVHAPYPLALLLTICWVAVSTDPRTSFVCGAAVEAVLLAAILIWSPESWWAPVNLELLLWPALAVAAGEAVRHRRAFVTAMEDRVRRLETSREEELRHRVIEERLRIARELHDVVAHHIALINVQAAVAAHVLYEQPSVAETALRHVTEAGSSVLDELGSLLAVLRQPGDPEAPVEPTPGLDRLDELLDRFAAAGLRVDRRVDGEPRRLPTAVDLTAYRLLQESLTNAHKHGDGAAADLQLVFAESFLHIEVHNPQAFPQLPERPGLLGQRTTADDRGHGLLGMRERVASVGGSLAAGPTAEGGFRVTASLPVPGAAE